MKVGLMLLVLVSSGCASAPNANPRDPWEPFNRGVYQFNDAVDVAVLKPVATAYQTVTPEPVQRGVSNFYENLKTPWSFINNALQFKGQAAIASLMRFAVNTVIGVGGIFDVASEIDIEKHTKDFGHTLGYWGVPPGPYLVLPLLGPSSVRDSVAVPADLMAGILSYVDNVPLRNSLGALGFVDERAKWLKASTLLEEAALDKYSFTRDAYLQRRRNTLYDGNPPEEDAGDMPPTAPALTEPTANEKVKP
jgi:phospholipid-binding lipoprotein MlaA